ncbi:hypothetical protein CSOJ01_04387 [Colletotrichum sojae]|uniref:Uncharacterized protein n=1 Tax=Colletotrichum sojae TaxID=2175907 RepID=A0A8H6JIK2_9PEZI|nr:hypothetical protein CSOJ01_04387 [Colletotrichum sojae]
MPLRFEIGPQGGRETDTRAEPLVGEDQHHGDGRLLASGACHLLGRPLRRAAEHPSQGWKTKKGRRRQTCLTRSCRDGSTNLAAWGRAMGINYECVKGTRCAAISQLHLRQGWDPEVKRPLPALFSPCFRSTPSGMLREGWSSSGPPPGNWPTKQDYTDSLLHTACPRGGRAPYISRLVHSAMPTTEQSILENPKAAARRPGLAFEVSHGSMNGTTHHESDERNRRPGTSLTANIKVVISRGSAPESSD